MWIRRNFTENYKSVRYHGRYFIRKRVFICFWAFDMDNTPCGGYETVSEALDKIFELQPELYDEL